MYYSGLQTFEQVFISVWGRVCAAGFDPRDWYYYSKLLLLEVEYLIARI